MSASARAADAAPVFTKSGVSAPASPDFGSLYPRYLDTVFSYVLQRVRDYDEAEDITIETFEAALVSLPMFRGECRPDAWLLAIARRQMAKAARRFRRSGCHELVVADLIDEDQQLLGGLLAVDMQELPEDHALWAEASQVMRRLLARLPEAQREVLVLQVCYRLSIREVARVLGRTEAAANSLLQRARAAIFQYGLPYFQR